MPTFGRPTRATRRRCDGRFLQRVECGVKQFADATTVHGGNAIRLPQTHLPEFGGQVFAFAIIDLVHRKRHRLAGGTEHFDDAFVRVGETDQTVHHENHGIGKLHGDLPRRLPSRPCRPV